MNCRLVLWWATAIGLATWVTLHVAIVLLVQSPWPLLPPEAQRAVTAYVDPIFRQSWWLFAPNPPAFDRALYVRATYRVSDRASGRPTDVELRETAWLALSEPLLRSVQENRLSVRDADLKVVLHGMYTLSELAVLQMTPNARVELFEAWSDLARQPAALIALERIGSAALASSYPDLDFQQVQIRLILRRLPPFSDRAQALGDPEIDLTFPAVPFQDVAPWSPD